MCEGNRTMLHKSSSQRRRHPILDGIQHSPIATVVSDPRQADNPLIAVNQAFLNLTGYDEEEVLGRNCRFLRGIDTETTETEKLRTAIQERRSTLAELVNYRKDGSKFRNAVMIAPLFDGDDELEFFVGSQIEIPAQDDSIAAVRQQQASDMVSNLSPRQREILRHMAQGYRTKQIAYMLTLSEKTVQMHRMLLFKKLSTSNAADAVRIAVEAGI
jgi:PAS domain S-box-containing protein